MPRTTINLSDERYRALKQAAARRGQTITEIVDQALELAGVSTRESVAQMLAEARRRSGLTVEEATRLAIAETRADRAERAVQAARAAQAVQAAEAVQAVQTAEAVQAAQAVQAREDHERGGATRRQGRRVQMARLYVIDTSAVVSGVIAAEAQAAPVRVVDAMVTGRLPFVIAPELLAEYRRILTRPAVSLRHALAPVYVDALLAELTTVASLRQPPDEGAPEDSASAAGAIGERSPVTVPPGDGHVVRLLAHEQAATLVSDDYVLLNAVHGWREALTSAELVERARLPGA